MPSKSGMDKRQEGTQHVCGSEETIEALGWCWGLEVEECVQTYCVLGKFYSLKERDKRDLGEVGKEQTNTNILC